MYSKESLLKQNGSYTREDFVFFYGGCCSQWFSSKFMENGIVFTCAEQYMMYHKAILFGDTEMASKILASTSPKQIKAYGRKVKNFSDEVWNRHKYNIVKRGNVLKFSQNAKLLDWLVNDTKNKILVEASPYDRVWGIGLGSNEDGIENITNWKGENLLGFAIMEVRDMLREIN